MSSPAQPVRPPAARPRLIRLNETGWFADAVGSFTGGASYLLGGAPGSRKSGLVTQVAVDLALAGHRVLYVPTEEPADRVWERAVRMTGETSNAVNTNLLVERNPPAVASLPGYVASQVLSPAGSYHGVTLVVLDSVQGHGLASAATRTYDRVLEATRLLSAAGVTSLLVNQLTKRNELAGPRTLEHGVDCVLMLRKTPACRLLFVIKNRHGPASLRDPTALLLDPVTLKLAPTPLASAQHAVAHTYLGSGLGPVKVQASVSLAGYGRPGRVLAPGLPKAELQQLVGTIGELPGVEIDDMDFSINCRLPGRRRYVSSSGLALAAALLSSYLRKPVPSDALLLGEVDLGRGVCAIDDRLLTDLNADLAAGTDMTGRWRIFCHPATAVALPKDEQVTPMPAEKLETVMFALWPELR